MDSNVSVMEEKDKPTNETIENKQDNKETVKNLTSSTETITNQLESKKIEKEYISKFSTNLERFKYICKDLMSPSIFIDFNFYFMISSCLARKVWIGGESDSIARNIYPNLYLIFVAPPGIGKSLPADIGHNLISNLTETRFDKNTKQYYVTKLLNLGPDAISFEKLIMRAQAASDIIKTKQGKMYHHSSTTFCLADELGMLFHDNTKRIVYFLTKAWDCPRTYEDDYIKRGELTIPNICINFLGCCPPRLMRDLAKSKILDDGFNARVLFIYGDKKRSNPTKIGISREQIMEGKVIQKHLRKLATLPAQEIDYSPEAYEWLDFWTKNELDKCINQSTKLEDYRSRRQHHLIKMAINIHYSREKFDGCIKVIDFIDAKSLLYKAEERMHLALNAEAENSSYNVAQEILKYLKINGTSTKMDLKIKFYDQMEINKFEELFDFLVQTDQCNPTTLKGKSALCLKTTK